MLYKNATLVTDTVFEADLRVKGEKIAAIGRLEPEPGEAVLDLTGKLLLPGIIDAHTHYLLEARGALTADDVYSGSVAALIGGVTTVIDYANMIAGAPLSAGVDDRKREFVASAVDYNLHLVITDELQTADPADFAALKQQGITSVKLFTTYREAGYMLSMSKWREILAACRQAGLLVTVHAEDDEIVSAATAAGIAAGKTEPGHHPDLRPAAAEVEAVRKLISLCRESGCPLYVVHLSTGEALALLTEARAEGLPIYVETAPHYLLLDRASLARPDGAQYLMTPPLRTEADCHSLWQGIGEGAIDVIATDHCAYTPEQKALGKTALDILPGIPGSETLLPLMYTYGVDRGRIELPQLVSLLATRPAELFGLEGKGALKVGADADLVVYDPEPRWQLSDDSVYTRAGYTPFAGTEICGQVEMTVLRGQIVVRRGRFTGSRSQGRFVPEI